MPDPIQAYPLQWPPGWRRTSAHQRARARFSKGVTQSYANGTSYQRYDRVGIGEGVKRVVSELTRMRGGDVVISSNVPLRNDGLPRADARNPTDPGVAVYWGSGKQRRCMAIDLYDRVADNLAAIAATLDAMRAIERHGGAAILDRAFTGFIALPAPEQPWQVLGLETSDPTRDQVDEAHRRLAMKHHPDRGGDPQQMARINTARDELLERMRT